MIVQDGEDFQRASHIGCFLEGKQWHSEQLSMPWMTTGDPMCKSMSIVDGARGDGTHAPDGSTPVSKDERLAEPEPKLSNIIALVTGIGIG